MVFFPLFQFFHTFSVMAGLGFFNHGWTRINTDLGLICVYPCPSVVGIPAVTEKV